MENNHAEIEKRFRDSADESRANIETGQTAGGGEGMKSREPVVEIIDPMMVDIYRRMSPAEKLSQAFDMWDFAISLMTASIRRDRPGWSVTEIQREILRRLGRSVPHE